MAKAIDEEMAGWYIRRAYYNCRQARKQFNHNNVESIIASYEAIEFSIKAMCKVLGVNFAPRKHFVEATTLSILGEKVEREGLGSKKEILQIIPVMLSYTEESRNISRYGIEKEGVPSAAPSKIFRREYAESVLKDAETLCDLLRKIEMKRRRWKPKIKMGILNGFVTGIQEIKCSKYPYTNNDPNFWKKKIETLKSSFGNVFEIKEINATEIGEEFAIVLNPFGEEYPEIDLKNKSIFYLIKDYVEDGGVYVNTAGFPFFYVWDVQEGKEYPICESRIILPTFKDEAVQRRVGIILAGMQTYLEFIGTLLFKEFDALPTPISLPRDIFQEKDDINNFGDLSIGVGEINEFRALQKRTKDCIPIVRAVDRMYGEIYPICALKRGAGYLLLAGMNTEKEKEADLFARAIDGFCNWIISQL